MEQANRQIREDSAEWQETLGAAQVLLGDKVPSALTRAIRDNARRDDRIVDQGLLATRTIEDGDGFARTNLIIEGNRGIPTEAFKLNDVSFDQLSENVHMPVKYARYLRANHPSLLDRNFNQILGTEEKRKLVRILGGDNSMSHATAILSDKFKTFDNIDLLMSVIYPLIESHPTVDGTYAGTAQWEAQRVDFTEKRMYIKFASKVYQTQAAAVGDMVGLGLSISNSESGHGAVTVEQLLITLACLNGMTIGNRSRTAHLGGAKLEDEVHALLTDETKALDNQALASKLRDIVGNYSATDSFDKAVDKFREAGKDGMTNDTTEKSLTDLSEGVGRVLNLSKPERASVLHSLVATLRQSGYVGNPVNRATLVNAVTGVQNTCPIDDRGLWENRGAKLLDMSAAARGNFPVLQAA